jgi:hypothetical protein
MKRTKAEMAIFTERDRLIDKKRRTPEEDLRFRDLQSAVRLMPTQANSDDQAAMDFIRDATRTLITSGVSSQERLDEITRLRRENYALRKRVIALEAAAAKRRDR